MIKLARRRLFRMVIPRYPAFNIYSAVARQTTALGPVCVATTVSRLSGWEAEVVDENNYRFPGPTDEAGAPDHAELQALRPADAVGVYGGLSCTVPRALEVVAAYRKAGVFVVVGGHHFDALPGDALRAGADAVVHGEGEVTIAELLGAFDGRGDFGTIAGISRLRDGREERTAARAPLEEFEDLPLPDFGLMRYAKISVFPVSRIRGCGMNCEFCAVKGRARCASPERLMAQISAAVEGHRAHNFFVVDDQFAQDRDETLRFCRMLREYQDRLDVKLYFTVQIRLDCGRDDELLSAMRAAGIRQLAIGIESPIEEELRAMGKSLKVAEMTKLALSYHRHGFMVHGMFIFGYPMRPGAEFRMGAAERVRRFRRFIREARMDTVQVLLPVPLPGTTFRERLEKQGRVFPVGDFGWEYYDGNFPLIVPDEPMTPADLPASSLAIMGRFYRFMRMPGVVVHTLRFPLAMLPLVNLRQRWSRWYRRWRNDVICTGGYFVMKAWKKQFRDGPFRRKLAEVAARAHSSD